MFETYAPVAMGIAAAILFAFVIVLAFVELTALDPEPLPSDLDAMLREWIVQEQTEQADKPDPLQRDMFG